MEAGVLGPRGAEASVFVTGASGRVGIRREAEGGGRISSIAR
jgi:hypothetical protein